MTIRYSSSSGTPFGNTANRPANAQIGQTYYNGQLGYLEIYTESGWIPATGANDFSLNITGLNTTVTFNQTYSSGSYSIVSFLDDATLDIYAFASDGSLAGYSNTKAFTATQRFNKMVVLGGTNGDVLQFSYKTTYATSVSNADTSAGPYITSISPSSMPNINDTVTITGGNFANDVAVNFTANGYSSTPAKSIVRSSSTSLIVTRPDNFPVSASPYTVTVTNPSVPNQPVGSSVHISSNSITAGASPVWNTSQTLTSFSKGISYSTTLSATDQDTGGSINYTIVSGSLPTGLSLNSSTGVISGTATSHDNTTFTVRATDAGGNFLDRAFTLANAGPTWITTSIPAPISGVAYSTTISASDDSNLTPTYSLVSGSLPTGLSFNSSTGVISGTPSASGNYTFTVRATDTNGNVSDNVFAVYVFSSSLVAAFDASGSGVSTSGSSITSWNNIVNSVAATQSTTQYRPTLISNAQNGKSVARFDGTKWMSLNTNINTLYMIAVAKPSGGEWTIETTDVSYTANGTLSYSKLGGVNVKWAGYGTGFNNTAEGDYRISGGADRISGVTSRLDTNTFVFEMSNALGGDPNPGIGKNGSILTVGTNNSIGRYMRCVPSFVSEGTTITVDGGSHFNGDLAEVLLFNAVPSSSDLSNIVSYLKTKWNVNSYQPAFFAYGFNNSNTSSGSNNTEIALANTSYTTTAKLGSHSLSLNGSNSYATIPFSSTQSRVGTVAFWIYWKGHNPGGRSYIIDFRNSTYQNNGYWIIDSNNTMTYTSASTELSFSHTPALNTWEHYALVSDGFNVSFYKNGALVNTNTNMGGLVIQGNAYLGTFSGVIGGNGNYFTNANIDNFYYSTYPASVSDINNLYNSQIGF